MKSDPWTRDFDGFGKSGERCIPAAGEALKSGTPAVTRPQRPLVLPMMALQRPLSASGHWEQGRWLPAVVGFHFFSGPPIAVFHRALEKTISNPLKSSKIDPKSIHKIRQTLRGVGRLHAESMDL
ncbi:hypothetical protein C2S52_007312 [Perilla frutescens var. hirtella]|nr:hypothetical protein C2S52_007312 [Perilla frutescens var. hirtella]